MAHARLRSPGRYRDQRLSRVQLAACSAPGVGNRATARPGSLGLVFLFVCRQQLHSPNGSATGLGEGARQVTHSTRRLSRQRRQSIIVVRTPPSDNFPLIRHIVVAASGTPHYEAHGRLARIVARAMIR